MSRMTIDKARRSTDMFSLRRFGGAGTTKESRHQAWLSFRTEGVGGSDMSTILGFNTYKTPYELWLEKTGRQEPEDISGRWAIIKGNALEVELRRRFRQLHPEFQVIDGTDISLVSDAHPVMHASLDGFIYDEASDSWGILEIKTANANRGRTDWHDDAGELIAPAYYVAQVTHYMAVTGFRWGYFYADIGEAEPVEVRFERDEDDVDAIIHAAEDFWGFVARDEMPALTIVGEVNGFHGYQTKQGESAASCNVNASAVAITNVRQKNGGQQGYGTQAGYTQQPQGQAQPPASDPWSSDPSF